MNSGRARKELFCGNNGEFQEGGVNSKLDIHSYYNGVKLCLRMKTSRKFTKMALVVL